MIVELKRREQPCCREFKQRVREAIEKIEEWITAPAYFDGHGQKIMDKLGLESQTPEFCEGGRQMNGDRFCDDCDLKFNIDCSCGKRYAIQFKDKKIWKWEEIASFNPDKVSK